MRATAILPIKRFATAKSRLGAGAAAEHRPELARAMLTDVLAALVRCRELDAVIVVTGDEDARAAALAAGAAWLDDPEDASHSLAAAAGVDAARAGGARCAALIPGDCPLLSPDELDEALGAMAPGVVGVVPDRAGSGTNGLLLAPPGVIEPAFGPGSRERHLALARAAGAEARLVEIPSLALDLDTDADVRELGRVLEAEPDRAPATAAVVAAIPGLAGRAR